MDIGENKRLAVVNEKDAAEILNISAQTLQAWRQQKTGPAYVKVGRLVKYRIIDLEDYINRNTIRSQEEEAILP